MLQIEMLPVDWLVPYIRSARTHSEDQIAQIAASIAEFGFTNPILVGEDEVIIAGHGRLMAAKALGQGAVNFVAGYVVRETSHHGDTKGSNR